MYRKILVPVDGSPTSQQGLDEALEVARLTGASLELLHVLELWTFAATPEASMAFSGEMLALLKQGGESILAAALARAQALGCSAETKLVESFAGRVCDLVVDEAARWGADLIVIGTHGRRGVRRMMLGSDAEQVARMASVPVLLVRGRAPGSAGGADAAAGPAHQEPAP